MQKPAVSKSGNRTVEELISHKYLKHFKLRESHKFYKNRKYHKYRKNRYWFRGLHYLKSLLIASCFLGSFENTGGDVTVKA